MENEKELSYLERLRHACQLPGEYALQLGLELLKPSYPIDAETRDIIGEKLLAAISDATPPEILMELKSHFPYFDKLQEKIGDILGRQNEIKDENPLRAAVKEMTVEDFVSAEPIKTADGKLFLNPDMDLDQLIKANDSENFPKKYDESDTLSHDDEQLGD